MYVDNLKKKDLVIMIVADLLSRKVVELKKAWSNEIHCSWKEPHQQSKAKHRWSREGYDFTMLMFFFPVITKWNT